MRSGKITVLLVALLLGVSAGDAAAQFKGLFLAGDLRQSIVLDYNYKGQNLMSGSGRSSSSSQNRFSETYNAGMEYSILHPYILNGDLKAGVGLDQGIYSSRNSSSTTSGNRYSYDINGVIFKISPTPANFSVRSETIHVSTPFSPGYDVVTDSRAAGASFKHKIIGLRVDYQDTVSETNGTSNDSRQKITLLTLKADNNSDNSMTEVQITHLKSALEPLTSAPGMLTDESFTLNGKNVLLSSRKDKSLNSSIFYREAKQKQITRTFSLGESFKWQLGKALSLGASYENSSVSATAAPGNVATETTQQIGTVILNHQLYKSLSTRLRAQGRQNDMSAGRETEYSGSLNLLYSKKLTGLDTLTLNYAEEYSVIDRKLSSGGLAVIDEVLTAQINGSNLLQQPNVESASIIVRDQENPLIRYDERDFRIVVNGAATGFDFAVFGSRITEGKRLLVSYQFDVDASVNYRRSAHGGGGAITFDDGVYQVYTNISQSSQEVTSGQAGVLTPGSSMDFLLGATRNKNGVFASMAYGNSNSRQVKNQHLEGIWRITRYFEGGALNVQAKDRQTWYGGTSFNSRESSENQFSISSDYSKNVLENALLTLRASYFRVVATSRERNDVILESIYRWGEGRLFMEVSGKVQYRNTNGDSALDNQLHIRVSRSF